MIRLALLLPTNKPKVFKEVFMQSVHNLQEAKEHIIISINFQSPWTKDEIDMAVGYIKGLEFNVVWSVNSYNSPNKGEIPFNRIRYDCARQLDENIDYFGLCDDDFWFDVGCGEMISKMIKKFDDDATVGLMQCRRKSRFMPIEEVEPNPKVHLYFTDCGFFFRRLDEFLVFPDDAIGNIGAGEEYVIGNAIVERGYKIKLYLQSDINHLLNYGGLRNNEWMKNDIMYSPLGNMTYIMKYYNNENNAKEIL